MKRIFSKRNIISAIGVVFLGAFSSPLWDYVLKPCLGWCYRLLLNISIFGYGKFKNQIYLEIAKGFHERASLKLLALLFGVIIGFVAITVLALYKKIYSESSLSALPKLGPKKVWKFLLLYSFFLVGLLFVQYAKETYINSSIVYYNQLLLIDRPYMSPNEIAVSNSEFAQINSKSDFTKVVSTLKTKAVENKLSIPDFKFTF